MMSDYDEGYRAGMQKMREVGQRRIEELEAENKRLKSMIADVIHDTGDDPKIMAASRAEWAERALAAEAKLAKALALAEEALDFNDDGDDCLGWRSINDRIEELKGQDDE